MNWKKLAFMLALVAGLCGGTWAQSEHHRDRGPGYESNADYQAGYNQGQEKGRWDLSKNRAYQPQNYQAYKNGDEAFRRGFVAGYDQGYGRREGRSGWEGMGHKEGAYESNADYQAGYNQGEQKGRSDLSKNRAYQPQNYQAYKNGNEAFRRGFVAGYDEGFGRGQRRSQWGRDHDHDRDHHSNPDYQAGYNEGMNKGRYDLSKNRAYQPQNYQAYKNGNEVYRRGFVAGYDEGFGRRH